MEDYENILLANIISKPEVFIREIAEREGHDRYIEWRRIQESLTKVVKDDLNQLNDDWQSNFVSVIIKQSRKYKPFLNIDEKKFKRLIRERFF